MLPFMKLVVSISLAVVWTLGAVTAKPIPSLITPPHNCSAQHVPAMPTKRALLAATVFDSKLFAMGGYNDDDGVLNTVEVFDGSGWSSAPSMTTKRQELAAAVFDSKLFVMGGYSDYQDRVLDTVEVFDGSGWSSAPSMTTKRLDMAAIVFDSKLFVMGGFNHFDSHYGNYVLNTVEMFNGTGWSSAPSMKTARRNFAATVFDSKLFVMGGYYNNDVLKPVLNTVEVFDGSGWSFAPSMKTARAEFAATVFDSKLFVMGGLDYLGDVKNFVEMFNGTGWSSAPSMKTARGDMAATVFDSKLFVVGGENDVVGVMNTVEVFDGNAWGADIVVCVSNVKFPHVDFDECCADDSKKATFLSSCTAAISENPKKIISPGAKCTHVQPSSHSAVVAFSGLVDAVDNALAKSVGGLLRFGGYDLSGASVVDPDSISLFAQVHAPCHFIEDDGCKETSDKESCDMSWEKHGTCIASGYTKCCKGHYSIQFWYKPGHKCTGDDVDC